VICYPQLARNLLKSTFAPLAIIIDDFLDLSKYIPRLIENNIQCAKSFL
jgi:hypothetical protein